MNQADKAEALRWIKGIVAAKPGVISGLVALIERQPDDTDGEMWRFCVEHGFPMYSRASSGWRFWVGADSFDKSTPVKAVQAAMAAMKEKA